MRVIGSWALCLCVLLLFVPPIGASAQSAPEASGARLITLGELPTGARVNFLRGPSGEWGIDIGGADWMHLMQPLPAQLEMYAAEQDVCSCAAGYSSVARKGAEVLAHARVHCGDGLAFAVEDRWRMESGTLVLSRKVTVEGGRPGAGFLSAIRLMTSPEVTWPDVEFLAPGLLYGDPRYDGDTSPGGLLNHTARRFWMREDFLPAPLFALRLRNGDSLTVLNAAPRGDTTLDETRRQGGVLIDERFQFAALGANEASNGGVEIGLWLPGTVREYALRPPLAAAAGGQGTPAATRTPPEPVWRRRYHPARNGFAHSYEVGFRFARGESFPDLTRNSWRWAWNVLKPGVNYHDIDVVRRSLIDHLSDRVVSIEGRTGIPFIVSTKTGEVWGDIDGRWNDPWWWWRAVLGFVGKNLEAADQLLREAERDSSPRGQKMRRQAMDIIDTFIRLVPMRPAPVGSGFNLKTGKPSMTNPQFNTWYLRAPAEDMYILMQAYRREKRAGREHPEWLRWCREFADWTLTQQRSDGSFPRGFRPGTGEVAEESGTTSYNVVPLFVLLSQETGDPKYLNSALRAAEYVWESFGTRGVFIGGAIDNPNITDKEAGMLSLEAFLALYEATKQPKWLARARVAGDFAETWMWIWNVPMPPDADDEDLHWKKNVPTVGVQGITARVAGHVDQFLDWSVPAYVKLYRYTGDVHYKELARILLHNCKAMLALPGRTYGMAGPGWQQENWRMGPSREGRGYGTPEKWMPWVSTNHLYGITKLEENDPDLFLELSTRRKGR